MMASSLNYNDADPGCGSIHNIQQSLFMNCEVTCEDRRTKERTFFCFRDRYKYVFILSVNITYHLEVFV